MDATINVTNYKKHKTNKLTMDILTLEWGGLKFELEVTRMFYNCSRYEQDSEGYMYLVESWTEEFSLGNTLHNIREGGDLIIPVHTQNGNTVHQLSPYTIYDFLVHAKINENSEKQIDKWMSFISSPQLFQYSHTKKDSVAQRGKIVDSETGCVLYLVNVIPNILMFDKNGHAAQIEFTQDFLTYIDPDKSTL